MALSRKKEKSTSLNWWQLSLLGVGCTIGTGYFLGSSIGIGLTGPSIVIAFLLAALGTYVVFIALAKLTADDPQEGSFCYYAEQAFGSRVGFACGWNYWMSNILIIGSQLTALSILSRFWFDNVPLWVFASIYSILGIGVVLLGTKGFDSVENVLAVVKTAAILLFIVLGFLAVFQWLDGTGTDPSVPSSYNQWFPRGIKGFWGALIYAFYAFGGIEVIGLMAMQLKQKQDAPKSGTALLLLLAIIYTISLGLAVSMVSFEQFTDKESPFVTALSDYHLAFFPHVFNAAIIVAGFSTMTAALFGVTTLLTNLAHDGHAPKWFEKKIKYKDIPLPSLGLAVVGLICAVVAALLLPGKLFEYITTAAGILILFNWICIVLSNMRLLKQTFFSISGNIVGILLMLLAISGILAEKTGRPGFYLSIAFAAIIVLIAWLVKKPHKEQSSP